MKTKMLFGGLLIITIFIAGCGSGVSYSRETLDKLANCFADKNVKEYTLILFKNGDIIEKMF